MPDKSGGTGLSRKQLFKVREILSEFSFDFLSNLKRFVSDYSSFFC